VYCGSGIRSAKAAKILKEKGYDEVYECAGGLKAWKAADLPVE
jgi:rhodanese-related sulfurtransferase